MLSLTKVNVLSTRKYKDWFWGYILIAPTIIFLMILNIYPLLRSVQLSFMQDLGFNNFGFVGLKNYARLFENESTWKAVRNTIIFAILSVPIGVFISLIVANLLSGNIRGRGIYRVIFFIPLIVIPSAMSIVWKLIFHSNYGIVNDIISKFGFPKVGWIIDPKFAMITLCIAAIWSGLGQRIIILLAGITTIPSSLYEAAKIDGANGIQSFFHITIPMLTPSIFFLTITGFFTALREFDLVYLIFVNGISTTTSPALDSVRTLMYEFYRYGFVGNTKGYASSIIVLSIVIILIFTLIQTRVEKNISDFEG